VLRRRVLSAARSLAARGYDARSPETARLGGGGERQPARPTGAAAQLVERRKSQLRLILSRSQTSCDAVLLCGQRRIGGEEKRKRDTCGSANIRKNWAFAREKQLKKRSHPVRIGGNRRRNPIIGMPLATKSRR
jgi:hypothetical protein